MVMNGMNIGLEKLKAKTGSTSSIKKFRSFIRQISKTNYLPDYTISLSENDIVRFSIRRKFIEFDDLPSISPETLARGREIIEKAGTNWDYQEIHKQFSYQLLNGFQPEMLMRLSLDL